MKNYSSTSSYPTYQSSKDYTVSGESFQLLLDKEREMLITFPKPKVKDLPSYYQSENYISHSDSRRSLIDKIYQRIRRYMLLKKLKWIEEEVPDKGRILDIGAGTGDFLLEAKKRGWKVSGIEPSQTARNKAKEKGVKLRKDSANLRSEKFDVITLWHVLEHVYDLKEQIIEVEHLLKNNGLLIVAVPNFKSYDAQYYKEFWAAYDVPRHLWHFSRASFKHLFCGTVLKQTDLKPLTFDAFYVSLLSEKYRTGRPNYFKSLYIGLKSNLKARTTSEYSSIAYFFRKSG